MMQSLVFLAVFLCSFFIVQGVNFGKLLSGKIAHPIIVGILISLVFLLIFRILFITIFSFVLIISIFYYIRAEGVRRRKRAMQKEFVSAVDGIAQSLKAGLSIVRAFEEVSETYSGEVGRKFKDVLKRLREGCSLSEAMREIYTEEETEEWRVFFAVIKSASKSGASLSRVLTSLSHTMNESMKLKDKVEVLTSSQRFQGMLMLFIPFVALLLMFFIEPVLITNFVSSKEGFLLSTTALALQVSASYIIWKMTG